MLLRAQHTRPRLGCCRAAHTKVYIETPVFTRALLQKQDHVVKALTVTYTQVTGTLRTSTRAPLPRPDPCPCIAAGPGWGRTCRRFGAARPAATRARPSWPRTPWPAWRQEIGRSAAWARVPRCGERGTTTSRTIGASLSKGVLAHASGLACQKLDVFRRVALPDSGLAWRNVPWGDCLGGMRSRIGMRTSGSPQRGTSALRICGCLYIMFSRTPSELPGYLLQHSVSYSPKPCRPFVVFVSDQPGCRALHVSPGTGQQVVGSRDAHLGCPTTP